MGFSFKGVHSKTYGWCQAGEIPARPPVKTYIDSMPNANGSIDFTGRDGNLYYEDSVFTFKLQFTAANSAALRAKAKQIGQWLNGKGTLVIDGDSTQYTASCYEGLNYTPMLGGRYGEFDVSFRVAPWEV